MTRREMLQRIDARELAEWEIFYHRIQPFGPLRGDLQAGVIASLVANLFRDEKKHATPFSPADFLLKFGETQAAVDAAPAGNGKGPQPWQQIMQNLRIVSDRQAALLAAQRKKDTE
jgi:Protein of unknown function (DUF4035)